ncbi:ABC transporter substrate-binding protein [Blastococcus haudaquaticus]|uniref:Iron(III) transport system substrate-binding protein n=1 Tax=Blastococcus haudaquaticus TaxID=1938745 RepID=A0A286GIB7_9ACTN|nr:extracellular solute-binding protein [Blastococcus haudaquaticus]SOD94714.1 iron(III) transport system substrate-binding protein [Blastococcus haudaquaticus]
MRKPRTLTSTALAAGAVMVLAACGGNPTSSSEGSNGDAASGPTGAEQLYEEVGELSGQERRDRLVELAAEEDGLNLYTSMNADMVDAVTEAFTEAFDIDVSTYRAGSETVLQRILQEQDAGFAGNDVVETNATELMALQQEDVMAQCASPERIAEVPEAGVYDDWVATRFNLFAPSWNVNIINDPPKVWEDLADPKYDGQLALELGDYDWYMALTNYWLEEGKSQEEVDQLWADIVDGAKVVKGHTVMAELMSAGQYGLASSNYTYIVEAAMADGAPLETQPYINPIIARPNGGSCMKTAQNPATAMLFMDWLLEEGQAVLADQAATPSTVQIESELIPVDGQLLLDEGSEWSQRYDDLLSGVETIGG